MDRMTVTVFGGSGFVGRHLVRRLAADGKVIRVAVRDIEAANYLRPMGDVGQIVPIAADLGDNGSVAAAVEGANSVVNLVGLLYESGSQNFEQIHKLGATNVAKASADAGVLKLVQLSAIGASRSSFSAYARTKAAGEKNVKKAFPGATVIRPSIIFGPEDNFFNLFAGISRLSPLIPVFGCPSFPRINIFSDKGPLNIDFYGEGGTKFQPIYVGDVADAIVAALESEETNGNIYEIGGPKIYTSKEMMELLLSTIGRKRILAPIPFWYLNLIAYFMEFLPKPMLTRDQVMLLRRDNVVGSRSKKLHDLGVSATPAEAILPAYLARFRRPRSAMLETS